MSLAGVPLAWCPSCDQELRPHEVLLGRCPRCDEPLESVRVTPRTAREIADAAADQGMAL